MRKKTLAFGWKRKIGIVVAVCITLISATGCSYREFEDSLRSALKGETTEAEENVRTASINTETDGEKEKNVYYVGDTVKFGCENVDEAGNITFEDEVWYTLNKVDIVKDVNELGISMADFSSSFSNKDKISAEGKLQEGYSFIGINVTIKNIGDTSVDPDSGHNLFIEDYAAPESGISNQEGIFGVEGAYFSGHDENRERYYDRFSLAVGEEKTYTVGWVVADSMLEEPFYYIIDNGNLDATQKQYFLLNGTE